MRALQAYAPQIKEIQESYKDDKQRQQREMMRFYQENKINPLASCFPLLLQLPVFFALYQLLQAAASRTRCSPQPPVSFLFIDNLTEKATGGALVALIVLFIVTQLAASPVMAAAAEGTQRIIMFALPFVFAPFIDHASRPGSPSTGSRPTSGPSASSSSSSSFFPPPPMPTVEELEATKPPPPPPRKKKKRR